LEENKMAKRKRSMRQRFINYGKSFNYLGILLGTLLFCLSTLPSLLPRPWLMQGAISGVSFAIGYGLGLLTSKAVRWLIQKEVPLSTKRKAWRAVYFLPIIMLACVIVGHAWQNEVRTLVGQEQTSSLHVIQIVLVSVAVFCLIIAISRGLRKLAQAIDKQVSRWVPPRVGQLAGIGLTALIAVWIVNGFLLQTFVNVTNSIYANFNDGTSEGITRPESMYRSGSPASVVSWESLGSRGRDFVARGPSSEALKSFSGEEPSEPIRVYVGVNSAETARERARIAVEELKRTGAFERDVLVLATATGSGWLEPQAVDSVEYMFNGNTAIVTQQYSYLPSWISFLVDSENAKSAGRELYDAVYTEWVKLPIDQRPKLIAYGLSLGSFGGNAAYSSAQDLQRSVDGALFLGTPSNTELWRTITDTRDAGSPEVKPIFEGGEAIRFASNQADIIENTDQWTSPRTLYLQHASDPVIWWSYDLILHEPDWLKEPRGRDVSERTRWIPFVTFFQVTVDQFYGVTVPNGHGHNYADVIVDAWASVTKPDDWSQEKSDKLQAIINSYENE
jgi:uncharacterized membrane protein